MELQNTLNNGHSTLSEDHYIGYFKSRNNAENLLYVSNTTRLGKLDQRLIEIFNRYVSIAFENIYLKQEIEDTQRDVVYRLGEAVETRSMETGNLHITFEESNGRAIMIFADDGKGIPADHLPKIFDPFFTTRRGSGGTGLELNFIGNIISQRPGGAISCDSEIGKGSTLRIEFPCDGPGNAEPAKEEAA